MQQCVTHKKIYYSQFDAEQALIDAWGKNNYREGSGPKGVYQCDDCGFYHWTSREPMSERLKEALKDGTIKKEQEANRWKQRF